MHLVPKRMDRNARLRASLGRINKSIPILVNIKNGAKTFNSVHKASCLKQNQKWEQTKFIGTVNTATRHWSKVPCNISTHECI